MKQPSNRCTVNNLESANIHEPSSCPAKDASVDLFCITLKISEASRVIEIQTRSLRCHPDAVEMDSPAVSRLRKNHNMGQKNLDMIWVNFISGPD